MSSDPNIPGPLGDHLSYSWNFSGLGTSTGASPNFVFATPGLRTVTLTVTDAFGLSSTVTHTIQIRSSGGGGGGGSDGNVVVPGTYDITVGSGGAGGSVCRRVVTGDLLRFKLLGAPQSVSVSKIGTNFVTLTVNGKATDVVQQITSRVDLNNDATLDLALTLSNVSYPYATLCLEAINVSVVPVPVVNNTTPVTPTVTPPVVPPVTPPVNPTAPAVNATGNATAPAGTGGWAWPFHLPQIPGAWIGAFIVAGIVIFGLLIYGLIRFGMQTIY
jgi:PKD repeat protein